MVLVSVFQNNIVLVLTFLNNLFLNRQVRVLLSVAVSYHVYIYTMQNLQNHGLLSLVTESTSFCVMLVHFVCVQSKQISHWI